MFAQLAQDVEFVRPAIDWHAAAPELTLLGFGALVTLMDIIWLERGRRLTSAVASIALLVTMIPILTRVVVAIPFLFIGSLLLESFFGIPGLGSMTVDAINGNDFSTLRVMVFIGALLFIAGQIATDVAYTLVDPRVRLE